MGFEVEKKIVFAPNNAGPVSVALSGIPVSCAVLSSFGAPTADELLERVDCVNEVVRVPDGDSPREGAVADRVAVPL